jgi:hypothetical protein
MHLCSADVEPHWILVLKPDAQGGVEIGIRETDQFPQNVVVSHFIPCFVATEDHHFVGRQTLFPLLHVIHKVFGGMQHLVVAVVDV